MRRSKLALFVPLFLFLLSVPSFAEPASLGGRIVDYRGYRMSGLEVTLQSRDGNLRLQTYADDNGSFNFENLEPGRYVLSTECEGIQRILTPVTVEAGRSAQAEMVALSITPTGTPDIDKFAKSSIAQGGSYPAGNISYLNIADETDYYYMALYFGILALLSVYGVYRYRMVYLFLRYRRHAPKPADHYTEDRLPRVTVQLPLYNEMYVAERLIDAVVKLDYPRELLEIQVLDDSTDGTCEIASGAVKKYFDQGFDISYHHRSDRTGFKAGALESGLKKSSGELVLIFDADFVPKPDCIRSMIDYFTDERVGMVQMRWSHINSDYSLLTRVQAIMLDGHFIIEQTARNRCGGFFNFNGTAGMWRREAIEWSGGWQHDTLAEDTDLSYRAQLMGWRFVYLVDLDTPSELPVEMNAFKSQQQRWAKGLVQVGLKMLGRIMRDPRLSRWTRVEQFLRLTGNLAAPLVVVLALVNFPILIVRYNQGFFHLFVLDVPILTLSTLSVVAFYVVPQWHLYPKDWKKSIKLMPFVMSMGIALTFSNARAVLEALFRVKTPFVRTPKYGVNSRDDSNWVKKSYVPRGLGMPVLELLFAFYFLFTVWYAIYSRTYGTIPFLLIYLFGYSYAAVMSIAQVRMNLRRFLGKKR